MTWVTEQAQGRMRMVVACPAEIEITADRDRLGQVLSILMDNALRYAASGGELSLRAQQQAGRVLMCVEDAGPGFASDEIERVCERFWRAEHSRSRHAGGSGLGLSVAMAICQAHGATLRVGNRDTGGARILIEWPG